MEGRRGIRAGNWGSTSLGAGFASSLKGYFCVLWRTIFEAVASAPAQLAAFSGQDQNHTSRDEMKVIAHQLTEQSFQDLTLGTQVIERDSHGPKVYLFENGDYLKIFRRKRLLSSALLTPYSVRFWRNAERLQQLGIPTVTPLKLFSLPKSGWTAVRYQALEGVTLKAIYEELHRNGQRLEQLADLFKTLHRKGIYFRSMHLGNIVLTPSGQLGLIDIADLTFQSRPLSRNKAQRNLAHFERYLKYNDLRNSFPFEELSQQVLVR